MNDHAAPTPTPDPDLREGSAAMQSRNALRMASALGLVLNRFPVEIRVAESLKRLTDELGEDIEQISDVAVYYWVYVPLREPVIDPETGEKKTHQAILIPEGEVRPFCLALAASAGLAHRFAYRDGVVPR